MNLFCRLAVTSATTVPAVNSGTNKHAKQALGKHATTDRLCEPKTDEALLRQLRVAASATLTAEEIDRQRVSFIVGTLKPTSGVTRDRVRDVLNKQEGRVKP